MAQKKSKLVQPDAWYSALPRKIFDTLEKVDAGDDWFSVYQIMPNIYAIYEDRHFQEVISYLVIGSEKALMVDSGLGIGNIRAVVEKLYTGQIIHVNTHSHFDHIGGNWQFPMTYIYQDPVAVRRLSQGLPHEMVEDNLAGDSTVLPYPEGFDPEKYAIRPCCFTPIDESFVADLGDWKFHIMHTPGHSPDSIMIYDPEHKVVFTGDTYSPATLYAHLSSPDGLTSVFETYRQTMHKVSKAFDGYTVIPSHNEPLRSSQVLQDVADAFDAIAAGNLEAECAGGLKKYQFNDFAIVTH